eukprot:TRINITY_DN4644_c0_g1_i1.p1 TRINITY_DN4644_c0_g1~~TRINITY_DN4644_c0_g1_i1.p1  ORF type:complete len:376 (+),score=51.11 TRINITY_DN4644_c0_g1_i1:100-1128(+)
MKKVPFGLFVGNPFVDATAQVTEQFLISHKLQNGSECTQLTLSEKDNLMKELESQFVLSAGGASLNSARMRNWSLKSLKLASPGEVRTGFVGAIGKDSHGEFLKNVCQREGLDFYFQELSNELTGFCCCMICKKERTLIAKPGASRSLTRDWIRENVLEQFLKEVSFVYATLFVLTTPSKFACGLYFASLDSKSFLLNLSSANLLEHVWERVRSIVSYATVIFSNVSELRKVAQLEGWGGSDIRDFQVKLSQMMKNGKGLVVTTQGSHDTLTATSESDFRSWPVPEIPVDEIVDTNGAGDAFVGGFLAKYSLPGTEIEDWVENGHFCASIVVKTSGFDLTDL